MNKSNLQFVTSCAIAALLAVQSVHADPAGSREVMGYCKGIKNAGAVSASWVSQLFRISVVGKFKDEYAIDRGGYGLPSRGPTNDAVLKLWQETSACTPNPYCTCTLSFVGPDSTPAVLEQTRKLVLMTKYRDERSDVEFKTQVMDIQIDALRLALEQARR